MTLPGAYQAYLTKFDTPHNDFHINLIRVFVGVFFAWKIMSRDFAFMGIVPVDFFYFYPIEIYRPNFIMLTTGVPGLMELVTFHWVHWIVGFPSEAVLNVVELCTAAMALMLAVAGRGPYRVFAIVTYVLVTYLWGFMFLSGQELDAVMLYFGMLLVLCATRYEDVPIWRLGSTRSGADNVLAGRSFSAILLVFVLYYGLSGYNKITDLSPADWFRYNLVQDIERTILMQDLGFYVGSMFRDVFRNLVGHYYLNYILVPLTYISHITVFIIFFKRVHIWKFAIFYTGFHTVTASSSIAFTGYMFVWWILIDWRSVCRWAMRRNEMNANVAS